MYTVKTMNNISDIIKQTLKASQYEVGPEQETYDALMVRSADLHETAFPQTLLAIARAGAGVNNIPVDACTEQGIVVFNTPGANANAVKELVLCGMLISCRKVIEGTEWVRDAHARGETGIGKLAEKAKQCDIVYSGMKISNAKTRWGSCSYKKSINLNWRLLLLPERLADYIIAHELAHIREMNHSRAFYMELERISPEWRWAERELRQYSLNLDNWE